MSIRDEINAHIQSGRLQHLRHSIPGERNVRNFLFNHDVAAALVPENWQGRNRYRLGTLRADLDRFTEGSRIAVMLHPIPKRYSFLKRLDPVRNEVWEIRSCDPKPGVRVLGRFTERDVFIGLSWDFREFVSWDESIKLCLSQWISLFPHGAAHSGRTVNDYVTNAFSV